MNMETIIKSILELKNTTQADLSRRANLSTATLNARVKSPNIRVDNLKELLDHLDYEIVIQPKGMKRRDGDFIYSGGEEK